MSLYKGKKLCPSKMQQVPVTRLACLPALSALLYSVGTRSQEETWLLLSPPPFQDPLSFSGVLPDLRSPQPCCPFFHLPLSHSEKLLSALDTLTISLGPEEQSLSVPLSFLCGGHRTPGRHGPRGVGP